MAHTIQRHPELVSGSVRGERQEKARGEMLKQVQHDNATKKQTRRLKEHKTKDEGHTEYMSEETEGKECASERREAEGQ